MAWCGGGGPTSLGENPTDIKTRIWLGLQALPAPATVAARCEGCAVYRFAAHCLAAGAVQK
eukprot:CAMPEP_0202892420 /NCGR_PEP_ID=MMETSP1392-20130828/2143_1 /ASSEMBLY_ACC=CAM_ASM_000868 /TAXON_ID=225041 /ORGANISM="Chlamydomonas chlamydogama, Strain SAG 11-48b" /LENGTH=60 /DNA_ID=CAMNT_0049576361 /DNA_START=1 /DNA_END=183 /DNA_ORIENTATION=+